MRMAWGSTQEAATLYSLMAAFPHSSVEEVGLCWLDSSHLPLEWGFLPGSLPPLGASPDAIIRHSAFIPADNTAVSDQQAELKKASAVQQSADEGPVQQETSQLRQDGAGKDPSTVAIEHLLQRLELSSAGAANSSNPQPGSSSNPTTAVHLQAASIAKPVTLSTHSAQPIEQAGPGMPPGLGFTPGHQPAQNGNIQAGVYTMQADGTLVSQPSSTIQSSQAAGLRADASNGAATPVASSVLGQHYGPQVWTQQSCGCSSAPPYNNTTMIPHEQALVSWAASRVVLQPLAGPNCAAPYCTAEPAHELRMSRNQLMIG